ncbi:hypothetical protein IQ07DRAFT_525625 [Pyrenochaeta sp. DS3sAY3a]|nr:hypothetical protein IQ07DRAFT_525625 [Pyrenochaeta sp. DS3sAY3a]
MKDAREIFSWTEKQKHLAIQLWLALDGESRTVQIQALLDSLCSFLHTTYTSSPLTLGFIQYLAVLSIDVETRRLRTAKNYSYMLAGIVYCIRVLSAEKLLPQIRRDELTDDDWDDFLEARKKYLADGSHSPMSETLSLLAYGKHIAQNQGNTGNAYWSEDKKIFYLNGRPIIVERF